MSAATFTCLACQVAFVSADDQRIHYRSDWHRYNLKRRIAGATAVQEDEFRERVDAQQQRTRAEAGKAVFQKECKACSKTYFSENAYNAHLLSKRHKELEAAAATATGSSSPEPEEQQPGTVEPTPDDAMDTESTTPQQRNWKAEMANAETDEQLAALIEEKRATAPRLPPTHCIFCPHASESTEDNLEHMSRAHSFFLPYVDQIEDLEGLLRGLADVVTVENLCLYCGDTGRRMHSLDAVRKHMLDKGHAKIGEEIEEFVEEYYDFEEEEEEGMEVDFYNGRREGPHITEDNHLQLPNGSTAIPRSLAPIYKQNLVPYHRNANVFKAYKLLGYHEEPLDVREKRRAQRVQNRERHRFSMQMGERGNGLQKYFRIQTPF